MHDFFVFNLTKRDITSQHEHPAWQHFYTMFLFFTYNINKATFRNLKFDSSFLFDLSSCFYVSGGS